MSAEPVLEPCIVSYIHFAGVVFWYQDPAIASMTDVVRGPHAAAGLNVFPASFPGLGHTKFWALTALSQFWGLFQPISYFPA
jgi:hypothetical protein